ncbi:hypothetical protein [Myroides odoratus]|uniref:Uncharacterized protein n=2 Tax=Myroides odoratus TaxID=256 RepID=A0A9Q7EBX5_MYROD|nr:hypothetical protein [Myroides odoratus]EHQ40884.1 hypothetical protein Myrod_0037 [Myroides odoratus DSM 2801]EHQ44568.1 hypothetical protein Myrod_3772 [Myroides odoratus DSM 2801]QQU01834.1 hypothetical protein I6I88_08870 [Myroides odoratus]WQD55879.1 hypothetical protein U0010_10110 [Myroides odoratus]STZ31915.1 Uncharacterised protein [Myroides odoratus]
MTKNIAFLLLSLSLFTCREQQTSSDQIELELKEEKNKELKKEKIHWQDLPQYVASEDSLFREVMKGRETKYQEAMERIEYAGLNEPPAYGYEESEYRLSDLNLLNELYYEGLKNHGFQFPDELTFSQGIQEVFGVNIYEDQSNNPRVTVIGDFLIFSPKLHTNDLYEKVPFIRFSYPNFIFNLKNRYYIDGIKTILEKKDDFGESYYIYIISNLDISSNNYIFHKSKAALNYIYFSSFSTLLVEYANYENFPLDYENLYQRIQTKYMEEYKKMSELSREGWDYRMYDRLFFSRGFDGKLIVKKKMLAAAVELAKEDEAYIRVPLNYYFIQMTTKYIPNEYAADYSEVHNYLTEREPFYTPEERAMIWVYTSLLELHLPPSETKISPYTFIGIALNYPELYEVAKAHDFFGEDMSEVIEQIDRMTINSPL